MPWQPRLLPPLQPTLAGYLNFLQGVGVPKYILSQASNLVMDNAGGDVTDTVTLPGDLPLINDQSGNALESQLAQGLQSQNNFTNSQVTSNPTVSLIVMSLQIALDLVNDQLCLASPDIYTLCVYNLATDRLINFGQDQAPQTFFADQRKLYNLNAFSPGIVTSTSDQSTSSSYLNPEFMKNLTLMDLQTLRTPFGRTYMGYAQSVGTLWGLS